jgi:hypothetical protein
MTIKDIILYISGNNRAPKAAMGRPLPSHRHSRKRLPEMQQRPLWAVQELADSYDRSIISTMRRATRAAVAGRVCAATIRMAARIASPENVPEPSSIASPNLLSLPHRTPPEPELFFLFLISMSCWCGPCGVVGDATASSKHSGKSTGLWGKPGLSSQTRYPSCRSTSTARGCRRSPRRGERVALASRWGHHDGAAASSGDPCVSL